MLFSDGVGDAGGVNNTCSNDTGLGISLGCHASGAPDWDLATSSDDCTECHTDTATPAVNPTSGLHNKTPTISEMKHDGSITGGAGTACEKCHDASVTGTDHHDGELENGALATYVWNTTNIALGYNRGADSCAAACHFTGSEDWGRKWVYADTATGSCTACHGDFSGWNPNVANHLSGGNLVSNHTDDGVGATYLCGECHVLGSDPDYVFSYNNIDWKPNAGETTSLHGDGTIQINSDANYDKTTDFECKRCHSADSATYEVGNTGWLVDATGITGVVMAGNCSGCHITGDSGTEFYPEGANIDDDASELNSGAHQKHVDAIAAAKSLANSLTCDFCHPANTHSGNVTRPADMGGYKGMDGSADGDAQFSANAFDDTVNTYIAVGAGDNTCSSVNCHNNITTPDWYTTGGASDTTPPTATTISATPGTNIGEIDLGWTATGDDGITGTATYYDIRYSTTSGQASNGTHVSGEPPPAANGTGESMTVGNLTPATLYYFAINIGDEAGNWSGWSAETSNTVTSDTQRPSDVTGFTAADAMTDASVILSWNAATDNVGVVAYDITGDATASVTGTSYVVTTGLTNDVPASFNIVARDAVGNTSLNPAVAGATPTNPTSSGGGGTTYLYPNSFTTVNWTGSETDIDEAWDAALDTLTIGVNQGASNTKVSDTIGFGTSSDLGTITAAVLYINGVTGKTTIYSSSGSDTGLINSVPATINLFTDGATSWAAVNAITADVESGGRNAVSTIDQVYIAVTYSGGASNTAPPAVSITAPTGGPESGNVSVTWGSVIDPDDDTVYYNVYGSDDNGTNYNYVIASGITGLSTTWDTAADNVGIGPTATARVKVTAYDGISGFNETVSSSFIVDNTGDTTAPAFAGVTSATDATTGGAVNVGWSAATDSSTPITYTLYWSTDTTPFTAPLGTMPGITTLAETVTGLTDTTLYYFGVRATDSQGNEDTNSASASATPTAPAGGGGTTCATCHTFPPTSGKHFKHGATDSDPDNVSGTCVDCHGDVAANYETNHSNGDYDFVFTGDGDAAYNGTYPETNETCATVDCHYNAPLTPPWTSGSTTCDSCHETATLPDRHTLHASAVTDCYKCHDATVNPGGTISTPANHGNGVNNVAFNTAVDYDVQTAARTSTGSASFCDNIQCHNDYTTPTWGTAATDACTVCHTAGGSNLYDPVSGLHNTTNLTDHDQTINGGTGTACEKCHDNTPEPAAHWNGNLDVPTAWNTTNIPAGYVNATDDCAATCHTDDNTTNVLWNRRWSGVEDAAWGYGDNASTALVCGNCHGSFQTGWNIVGETDHVDPDVDNVGTVLIDTRGNHTECTSCHGWNDAATNYATATKHINGFITTNSDLGYQNADGSCTTNCHGSYTGPTELTMTTASGWTNDSIAGGGVACGSCHSGGVTPGAESGKHTSHGADRNDLTAGQGNWTACIGCHPDVNYDLTGGTNSHDDTNRDMNFTYTAGTRNDITGSCNGAGACHDSGTDIAWNVAAATCDQCHSNTLDNDDFNGTNDSASMIDSGDYTATGHGKGGVAKACADCHDIGVAHDFAMSGSNPFRLGNSYTNVNAFCSNEGAGCHITSTGMLNHNDTNAGANYAPWTWTPNCTDCHDPHGDGTSVNNIKMVQEYVTDSASGIHGVGGTTDATAVDFTTQADIANGSYAATDGNGICQVCHTEVSMASFKDDDTTPLGGSHPTSGLSPCTSCHGHDGGFKASGCSGCHGGGNTSGATAANYWPDASNGNPENNEPGAHLLHVTRLASKVYNLSITGLLDDVSSGDKQKILCAYCHDTPGEDADHSETLPADVGIGLTPAGGPDNINYTASTCETSNCHNNKTTPVWTGSSTGCTMCHTAGGSGIADPNSGLHNTDTAMAHNDSFTGGGTCISCHDSLSTGLTNGSQHIDNGTETNANMGLFSGYNTGTQHCAASCHIDGGAWDRLWVGVVNAKPGASDNPGDAVCANCHGDYGDWRTGVINHANPTGEGPPAMTDNHDVCQKCHGWGHADYDETWRGALDGNHDGHGDYNITLNTDLTYNEGSNTCGVNCHTTSSGIMPESGFANYNYGAFGGLSCGACHSGGVKPASESGAHAAHGATSSALVGGQSNWSECNSCHPDVDYDEFSPSNSHNDTNRDMGGAESISYSEAARNNVTGYCASVSCHGGGDTPGWNLSGLGCGVCHTGSGGAQGPGAVGADAPHATNTLPGSPSCESCHFTSHGTRASGTIPINWDSRTMGTDYTADGKIYLKPQGGSTNEAETCWNCHTSNSVSEFSLNSSDNKLFGAYNVGYLTGGPTYAAGKWNSDNFAYKGGASNGTMRSTHMTGLSSVTPPDSTPSHLDSVSGAMEDDIRCASCHSVHRVWGAGGAAVAQTTDHSTTHYLRGTWVSNPFPEDGAPQTGGNAAWAQGSRAETTGKVPRAPDTDGSAPNNEMGGWQIEQNNPGAWNDATSYATYGGLCEKCHSSSSLWSTSANSWTGHKGVLADQAKFPGGTGNNFFDTSLRGGAGTWDDGDMAYASTTNASATRDTSNSYIGGLRNGRDDGANTVGVDGFATADDSDMAVADPEVTGVPLNYADGAVTSVTVDSGTMQDNFHNFPCSKCHNPHASRLPRLMITNCLDVARNTWDIDYNPSLWIPTAPPAVKNDPDVELGHGYLATELAYASTAHNCHRYANDGNAEGGLEPGWNSVTPW
jgi:hypothetical protein